MTITDIKHKKLVDWVNEIAKMTTPDNIVICDGSQKQYDELIELQVNSGLCVRLNEEKKPGCVLFDSDPSDVARVEKRTFIAAPTQEEAGPTNNWIDPAELKDTMTKLYTGCMKGRTMYVIPFSMGPLGSPISKLGVENRQNVVDIMPTFAPQVILFSKDDLHGAFPPDKIGHVWTIVSNDEQNVARVEEGHLWN